MSVESAQTPSSGKAFCQLALNFRADQQADYYPRRQDSQIELLRPETSFLEFFKQSLLYTSACCADPKCCSFFDDDVIVEGHAAPVQEASPSALKYPLL